MEQAFHNNTRKDYSSYVLSDLSVLSTTKSILGLELESQKFHFKFQSDT